jgi:hypothetical protein
VIVDRYGLGSWQRGREVIWEKALAALQVPIYLTIHGTGVWRRFLIIEKQGAAARDAEEPDPRGQP